MKYLIFNKVVEIIVENDSPDKIQKDIKLNFSLYPMVDDLQKTEISINICDDLIEESII